MPSTAAKPVKMNKKELEKYRRLLEDKKASLSAEIAKTRSAEEETTEESTQDIADKAVSSYTREFLYSLTDGERTTVLQIDEAIARVDDASYGLCTELRPVHGREAPDGRAVGAILRRLPGARREGDAPADLTPPSSSFARGAPVGTPTGAFFWIVATHRVATPGGLDRAISHL